MRESTPKMKHVKKMRGPPSPSGSMLKVVTSVVTRLKIQNYSDIPNSFEDGAHLQVEWHPRDAGKANHIS